MLIAVPSDSPGGLDANVSAHFGHCDAFTIVQISDGKIAEVTLLENTGHDQGGCMAPVTLLKQNGVEALVAGGMGMRPLAGFQQVGITVYFNEEAATVREAADLVANGKAREFGQAQTCGGGGECGGHHHHQKVEREAIEGKADIRNGRVVTMHYTLTDGEGNELDSSAGGEPMQYLHGYGNIVPGLEKALVELEAGDQKTVDVMSAEAYGERDESKTMEIPLSQLPPDAKVGAVLHARQPDGRVIGLTVVELGEETARIDFNHPLAGKDLIFNVTIVKVEQGTAEELQHGHPH